jgi:hypothetical protein
MHASFSWHLQHSMGNVTRHTLLLQELERGQESSIFFCWRAFIIETGGLLFDEFHLFRRHVWNTATVHVSMGLASGSSRCSSTLLRTVSGMLDMNRCELVVAAGALRVLLTTPDGCAAPWRCRALCTCQRQWQRQQHCGGGSSSGRGPCSHHAPHSWMQPKCRCMGCLWLWPMWVGKRSVSLTAAVFLRAQGFVVAGAIGI